MSNVMDVDDVERNDETSSEGTDKGREEVATCGPD